MAGKNREKHALKVIDMPNKKQEKYTVLYKRYIDKHNKIKANALIESEVMKDKKLIIQEIFLMEKVGGKTVFSPVVHHSSCPHVPDSTFAEDGATP